MDYGLALNHMFPKIDKSQYELMIDTAGNFYITRWDSTDTPKPNVTDIENYWNSTGMLEYFKEQKKSELKAFRDAALTGNFTSSALGAEHTYLSDPTSMVYFNATMNRFLNDSTFTTVKWWTVDAGYLDHDKDQFFKVFNDGHQFGISQDEKLAQLNADVDAATTVDAIDAITW
jgi:hypothetical protein